MPVVLWSRLFKGKLIFQICLKPEFELKILVLALSRQLVELFNSSLKIGSMKILVRLRVVSTLRMVLMVSRWWLQDYNCGSMKFLYTLESWCHFEWHISLLDSLVNEVKDFIFLFLFFWSSATKEILLEKKKYNKNERTRIPSWKEKQKQRTIEISHYKSHTTLISLDIKKCGTPLKGVESETQKDVE